MAKHPYAPRKKKDNSKRNAIIAFGATLLAYSALFSFHRISDILLGCAVALGISTLVKVMTAPMKGIDAPATSDKINPDQVQDEYAREMIAQGLELMSQLRRERDAINEYVFTRRLNELAENYGKLLNKVVSDHDKATHLRKLNSYYMPTAVKLLTAYREAKSSGTSYMEISATRDDILNSLDQLIEATKALMKQMLKSHLENIDIKIEVLEDILKADGYIKDELTDGMRASAEAAAAQIPVAQQFTPGAPAAVPEAASPAPAAKPEAPERPTIQVSMPTASAAQLSQGAPVLKMPLETDASSAAKATQSQKN